MTTAQKIIRTQGSVVELAKQVGNVSQAYTVMGYGRDASIAARTSTRQAATRREISRHGPNLPIA